MRTLIFDIETVGEDFDSMDETSKKVLIKRIEKTSNTEEYQKALEDMKNGLGLSPLTGEIVAIGVLDSEKDKGAVYFQAPGQDAIEIEEDGIKLKSMTEKEMLEKFWENVKYFQNFVSFNGRGFDVPFLMIRSAIHKIKPSKNLLSNRYLNSQRPGARHVDLMDQLTFYNAVWKKPKLHFASRAFGIKSPKDEGLDGDKVGELFKEKRFMDIAKYNVGDLRATKELYDYWDKFLNI